MFGGYGEFDALDDTWIFQNISNNLSWTQLRLSVSPNKRYRHAMATIDQTTIAMFGGLCTDDMPLDDTWIFTLTTSPSGSSGYWTKLSPLSKSPPRRGDAAFTMTAGSKALLFGALGFLAGVLLVRAWLHWWPA